MAKLSLVGAGPGDPELLTVKAWKCLNSADIVLYDALVGHEILTALPTHVRTYYVGKRIGNHYLKQEAINRLIVQYGTKYEHIVRLKGGDPFVFGRGLEEITYAELHNMETEVIPGISSAIGIPTSCSIPVTHRGSSQSFWVVTATTKHHKISNDLIYAAQSSATIIILMGTRKLACLVQTIRKYRYEYTPIALIQNGTLPNEKVIIGDLSNIVERSILADFSAPGIIIVGDVVGTHPDFMDETIQRILEVV